MKERKNHDVRELWTLSCTLYMKVSIHITRNIKRKEREKECKTTPDQKYRNVHDPKKTT